MSDKKIPLSLILLSVFPFLALSAEESRKQAAPAAVRAASVKELREALAAARPGSRILLAPGEYEGGLHFSNLRGEEGKPIAIAAEDPRKPPVIRGGPTCLQMSEVAHVELQDLIFEGATANGLNIDDGGTFDTPSHHVVLRGVVVRDTGRRGNEDGIKLSGIDDFRLEGCTVERWGRGGSAIDMVGCHRGVIERCAFRDKEKDSAATGVQAKGGSKDITIRRCRFEHAGGRAVNIGGSTGLPYFRPKPEGHEAKDIQVEGCTFVGSDAPIAFVGIDGATVRFNTFYRPRRWFLRILQETRGPDFAPCRRGAFTDNIIVYRSGEISTPVNIGPATAPETFNFARNYWFCMDRPEKSRPALPVEEKDGAGGQDPGLRDPEKGDLGLEEGSPARKHGAAALPHGAGALQDAAN